MKKRPLYFSIALFSLFTATGFSQDTIPDCAKWIQEIGPKRCYGEFSYAKLCPKKITIGQFEMFDKDSLSLNEPLVYLPGLPSIGFQYRGDISLIHFVEGRLPLHHFELRESFDDKKTLPVFEQGGALFFKCYYDVILDKEGKLVKGAEEYKTQYHMVLHGEITNREQFLASLKKVKID